MADLFTQNDTDLEKTYTIKLSIDTGTHQPIKLTPYKTPFAKCPIADKAVNDMLAANIMSIKITLELPYSDCWKKWCARSFCTGFRKLENISKKSGWPLSVIDDMLATLGKALLNEEDKEKTAFTYLRNL